MSGATFDYIWIIGLTLVVVGFGVVYWKWHEALPSLPFKREDLLWKLKESADDTISKCQNNIWAYAHAYEKMAVQLIPEGDFNHYMIVNALRKLHSTEPTQISITIVSWIRLNVHCLEILIKIRKFDDIVVLQEINNLVVENLLKLHKELQKTVQ